MNKSKERGHFWRLAGRSAYRWPSQRPIHLDTYLPIPAVSSECPGDRHPSAAAHTNFTAAEAYVMPVRLRLSDTALDRAMLSIGAQGPRTRDYTRGMTSLHAAKCPGTTWCVRFGDSCLLMSSSAGGRRKEGHVVGRGVTMKVCGRLVSFGSGFP